MHVATLLLLALCACACISVASARTVAERSGALLVFDRSLSGPLVAGLNVSVDYTVHNVGQVAALRVQLRDGSFPASRFDGVGGVLRHTFSAIKPGESESHVVRVAPKRAGTLFVSPPSLVYRDEGVQRVNRLAAVDTMVVEDLAAYTRRTASHKAEWATYAALLLLLVAAPSAIYTVYSPTPDTTVASGKKHG